jgi:hypothetical protein
MSGTCNFVNRAHKIYTYKGPRKLQRVLGTNELGFVKIARKGRKARKLNLGTQINELTTKELKASDGGTTVVEITGHAIVSYSKGKVTVSIGE